MGFKRKKSENEGGEEPKPVEVEKEIKKKKGILPSMIKNKDKRSAVHAKLKQEKKLEKRKKVKARDAAEKRALELGEAVRPHSLFQFPIFDCQLVSTKV